MFQLKTNSKITFTPLCVFGSNKKYGQMENQLHIDCKNIHFSCKSKMISRRERERERGIGGRPAKLWQPRSCRPHCLDHATPLPRSHRPSFFFFFFSSSSSTFLLPLAQCCWSSRHRPLAHYTPPPNPPSTSVSLIHCLSSIWVQWPHLTSDPHTFAYLSLSLTPAEPYPPPKAEPPFTKADPHPLKPI